MVKNVNGDIYSDLITSSRPESFWGGGERAMSNIKYIVIHGTASTRLEPIWATWSKGSNRQASAHYVVADNQIIGCVGENFIAWHSGGTGAITNFNSIGVEHLNSYIGNVSDPQSYLFSEMTIETGAKLVAELCKRLGIVPNSQTIVPHRSVSATSCPQSLDMSKYIEKVKAYYYGNGQPATNGATLLNNAKKGSMIMRIITFTDQIGNFVKGGMYLFNFNRGTYNYIANTEELKFIKKAYKECTGTDIPEEKASKSYPCHVRYIEGFNLVDIDK